MSDYSTHSICSGIKALAGLWSIVHALVNQINLKMTSGIIKSRARTGGRDPDSQNISVQFTFLYGFTGLLFAISSPPWILGHSHFSQVSVASSKIRRFIRWMKGGVTIHHSPHAVPAPLRDPSQVVALQLSTTFQFFLCLSHTACTPVRTPQMGSYTLYQPLRLSFALVRLLSVAVVNSFLKSKIHLKSMLEKGKKLFTPLASVLTNVSLYFHSPWMLGRNSFQTF